MTAKDDPLAGLALDDDELDLIRRLRKEKKQESEQIIHVRTKDGEEADVPFGLAKNWLRKIGVLLEDSESEPEPEQEEEQEEEKPKGVSMFGRRVG